jgi:hypothetical protein
MDFELFIPISLFAASAIVAWKYINERSRQRLAIIEKGVGGDDLKWLLGKSAREVKTDRGLLKWAFIAIGIGIAILLGSLVDDIVQEETTAGLIFILPGIGLILYYMIFGKKSQSTDSGH